MRMTRVNITVPEDVVAQARAAGLNVSRLATAALVEELDRRNKVDVLDTYLAELDRELGPIPPDERSAAAAWVDEMLTSGSTAHARSRRRRSA
jgi:hypothetical protein